MLRTVLNEIKKPRRLPSGLYTNPYLENKVRIKTKLPVSL